jgi:hypothetical protein
MMIIRAAACSFAEQRNNGVANERSEQKHASVFMIVTEACFCQWLIAKNKELVRIKFYRTRISATQSFSVS